MVMFFPLSNLLTRFTPPGVYLIPICTVKCVNYEDKICAEEKEGYAPLGKACIHLESFKKRSLVSRMKGNIREVKDVINRL